MELNIYLFLIYVFSFRFGSVRNLYFMKAKLFADFSRAAGVIDDIKSIFCGGTTERRTKDAAKSRTNEDCECRGRCRIRQNGNIGI